jgi:hypothetical protein
MAYYAISRYLNRGDASIKARHEASLLRVAERGDREELDKILSRTVRTFSRCRRWELGLPLFSLREPTANEPLGLRISPSLVAGYWLRWAGQEQRSASCFPYAIR